MLGQLAVVELDELLVDERVVGGCVLGRVEAGERDTRDVEEASEPAMRVPVISS